MMRNHPSDNKYDASANPPLGRVGLAVRRWRNMRGFGVHSPAAFFLMKEVVRPDERYGLYSYFKLDCLLQSSRLPYREQYHIRILLRMLLRLCCHLSPKSLRITVGHDFEEENIHLSTRDNILRHFPKLTGIRTYTSGQYPGLWIVGDIPGDVGKLSDAVVNGTAIVLLEPVISLAKDLYKEMPGGVRIMMPEAVILLPISGSAHSTYFGRLTR